jgi:hypothetical protein
LKQSGEIRAKLSNLEQLQARRIAPSPFIIGFKAGLKQCVKRINTAHRASAERNPGESIAMKKFAWTLCLVLLCSAILLGSSTPTDVQKPALDGTYTLDGAASDNVNQVIDAAVGQLNFLIRPIARGRLKKLNPVYNQVAIASSPNELSVKADSQPALRTPATGTPVAWVGPDGQKANVSMQLTGGHLVQTFRSADGRRVNDYTLSPDGRTLNVQVTETSPRLSQAIKYKLVYKRVS